MRVHVLPTGEAVPGNCLLGQLTLHGAAQHQALGHAAGAAYADVLPAALDDAHVYVR
jgi:hypothetical protein